MKNLPRSVFAVMLVACSSLKTYGDINIFACEPEWAALAQEIGDKQIKTTIATNAQQDPHYIRAKPSLLAAMRKADLVICSGASLEAGWLPVLLQKAGRPQVQPGSIGYLEAATRVPVLEKPTNLDRSQGDVHPQGNPHVHLNPRNIAIVAVALHQRMQQLDPTNATYYDGQFQKFSSRWNDAVLQWEKTAKPLRDLPVVVHHKSFVYLLDWLGMREVGTLESKPGIPPTTAHLEELLKTLSVSPAKMILRTPYDPKDASEWLAKKTGSKALVLPYTIDGDAQSVDLFGLFDRTINMLLEAANAEQ